MGYNNYSSRNHKNNNGQHRNGNGGQRRYGGGGQTYLWRVRWWNFNVRGGADQYKVFRSKLDAMAFIVKMKNNPNNYVVPQPEKWNGR